MLELISVPPRDWGCLRYIAEDDPEWRVPSVSEFQRVMWCGGDQASVDVVVSPQYT